MQTIAPTVLDPLAALEANKDAFGRPIYKEDRATNPTPGYLRSRENASEMSGWSDDALIDAVLAEAPLDILQLHGHETPERVVALRARHCLPVMKVVGVAGPDDLAGLTTFARVADLLLVDAKPPKDAVLPGGNGLTFDWRLIAGRRWPVPWMLAGGLTPANVAEAIALTGAPAVDVASGVESAPGVKDEGRIAAFCAAARGE
jgi:phosphoribosylanthranilate isomerase